MDNLFSNTGGKIKTVAKIVFILGIIGSIVLSIFFGVESDWEFEGTWLALTIIIAGPIASYVNSLFIYAVGSLFENVEFVVYNSSSIKKDLSVLSSKIESKEKQE